MASLTGRHVTNRRLASLSPKHAVRSHVTRSGEILVKGVKGAQSTQLIVTMGNIKFEKCPLYP
jgi:hypothetical protein